MLELFSSGIKVVLPKSKIGSDNRLAVVFHVKSLRN